MKAYIYQIINTITEKVYVGSTSHPRKREYEHFRLLKHGRHHSKKLQNSYNKYGKEAFKFILIDEFHCESIEDQLFVEQVHLDECKDCYNMSSKANTPLTGIVWTEEKLKSMGQKVSRKHKGKIPKNLEIMRISRWKPIEEYLNGEFVREYQSTGEAGRVLGIDYRHIHLMVLGKIRKIKRFPGRTWKYKT